VNESVQLAGIDAVARSDVLTVGISNLGGIPRTLAEHFDGRS
jgi:hypothetical protein